MGKDLIWLQRLLSIAAWLHCSAACNEESIMARRVWWGKVTYFRGAGKWRDRKQGLASGYLNFCY